MSTNCTSEIDVLVVRSETMNEEEEVDANLSKLVLQEIGFVKESFETVKHKADQVIDEANDARKQFEELMLLPEERAEERNFKLRQLKKKVCKMRMKIPFKLIAPEEQPHPHINYWPRPELDKYQDNDEHDQVIDDQSNYCYDENDDSPPLSCHALESTVRGLEIWQKQNLSCFFFFPENAFIKKSVLHCWSNSSWFNYTTTTSLHRQLGVLITKRLVKAVYKKSTLVVAGYRMYPSVHSHLRSNISSFGVIPPSDFYVGRSHDANEKYIYHSAEDLERFMPSTLYKKTVLHLGKWNNSTDQHIEVINPELFFKDISKWTRLRFISLRGISMIEELPKFITKLKWLVSLDLKACHNLEEIPSSIGNFKYLRYLDISECYFLDSMPKALATLTFLEVLKGFVVGERVDDKSCTLEDLKKLRSLKKLNIYTSMKGFPNTSQFRTLKKFEKLRILTISWRGCCGLPNRKTKGARLETLSFSIEKLDLQYVPETVDPQWLNPTNFQNLKKLYISGGDFSDLGQSSEETKWNVEILRLKHLKNLNIVWSQLMQLFPKLICLEVVNCPNLVDFPCGNNGFWKKNSEQC